MYCHNCQYDLRGQTDPRCPECGRGFDPCDPSTFDDDASARRRRKWGQVGNKSAIAGWTFVLVCVWGILVPARTMPNPPISYGVVARSHLGGILTTWLVAQYDHPQDRTFRRDEILAEQKPAYSAYSEQSVIRKKRRLLQGRAVVHALAGPLLVYALVLRLLSRGRIAWVATRLCILSGLALVLAHALPLIHSRMNPPSLGYVDDYVYLNRPAAEWDDRTGRGATTIVAFARRTLDGRRQVGYADGHLSALLEEEFRENAASQGFSATSE